MAGRRDIGGAISGKSAATVTFRRNGFSISSLDGSAPTLHKLVLFECATAIEIT
jgi:hypothetical protein